MEKKKVAPIVADINVTPMVDVMLVLLIIFMVITPLLSKGQTVELTKAKNAIAMKEADAELVLQRAREKVPQARPQIISDNGPQFVAKDFKEFLRQWQTTHVLTSPHYPQSNGKLERYHRTLKEQAIRPKTPLTLEDARRVVGEFVEHYNTVRLHSALGYVTPKDRLEGRHTQIYAARDRKLEAAREQRRQRRANPELVL